MLNWAELLSRGKPVRAIHQRKFYMTILYLELDFRKYNYWTMARSIKGRDPMALENKA
jgi:hypothetical protein